MTRLLNLIIAFVVVFSCVFIGSYTFKIGQTSSFLTEVSKAQGEVITMESGFILISFDYHIVRECGDTSIYGFIKTPTDFTLQLKPLIIPEQKAVAFTSPSGTVLAYPVWDIMPFLTEPGIYTIEVFVENNCSILNTKTVSLPPIPLDLMKEDGAKYGV